MWTRRWLSPGRGAPRPTGRALRVRAQVLAAAGDAGLALASAREAVSLLAPTCGRLEYARALRVLATLAAPDEAVPLLRESADLAWTCDAAPDYDSVITALAALGEPPPPLPPAAARLTTWERDVLTRSTWPGPANEPSPRPCSSPPRPSGRSSAPRAGSWALPAARTSARPSARAQPLGRPGSRELPWRRGAHEGFAADLAMAAKSSHDVLERDERTDGPGRHTCQR